MAPEAPSSPASLPAVPRPVTTRRLLAGLVLILLLSLGALFRLQLARGYHVPAVDGRQYFALSQQLAAAGRFAYGPPPAPPSFTRLPGYPLFLAFVAVRQAPVDLETHLVRTTRMQALLDVGTALLAFLILRGLRASFAIALLGASLVIASPLLFILASHALTETLATFLGTLEIYLALRATRERGVLFAGLAGLVAGAAQLVRADALMLLPAVLFALWRVPTRRSQAIAAFGLVAALIFAPWPIRNLLQFGRPYPAAWQWRTADGQRPLPTGVLDWARSFARATPDESFLDPLFAFERPWRPMGLLPQMVDSDAERAELSALIDRYDRERLSPEVDAGFRQLAAQRTRRAPLRTFVWLPLRRMAALFESVPNRELSMHSPLLGLPRHRHLVRYWDLTLYGLALLGALGVRRHAAVGVLLLAIVARCAGLVLAVPLGLSQRMLVEVFPVLICLSALGLAGLTRLRLPSARTRKNASKPGTV